MTRGCRGRNNAGRGSADRSPGPGRACRRRYWASPRRRYCAGPTPDCCAGLRRRTGSSPAAAAYSRRWQQPGWRQGTVAGLGADWFLDCADGPTPAERLDLMVPPDADGRAGDRRAPVLLYIHGGYWQALDKRDVAWLAPAFAARGVAFAALDYALAPMVAMDEIV